MSTASGTSGTGSSHQHGILHASIAPALLSGAVQAAVFNPYDRALYVRVKHRRRHFLDWRNFDRPFEGFLNASFYRTTVNGMYLFWQSSMQECIERYFPVRFHAAESPYVNSAMIGLLAGSLNGFLLNPLQVIKFRMWNGKRASPSFWQTLQRLHQEGGFQIFFRGCQTTVVRDCVFGVTYESVRRMRFGEYLSPSSTAQSSPYDCSAFVSNMCGALCASIFSAPFNFARTVVYGAPPGAKTVGFFSAQFSLYTQVRHMYRYGDSYVHIASMPPEVRAGYLRKAVTRTYPLQAWGWFNSRLNIGWGSLRIGLGMGISQNLFYFFQHRLSGG